jgi:hypothetical protein
MTTITAEPLDPEDMAWTIAEAKLIGSTMSGESKSYEFSPEIKKYVELILRRRGFLIVPKALQIGITLDENSRDVFIEEDEVVEAHTWNLRRKSTAMLNHSLPNFPMNCKALTGRTV